ncbi:hypothetical protein KY358_01825 [Candidatus Woesearchaeota archaeon]|nr:hypothetical protein [Candidatus Woesearchaeota archaeon]
MIPLALLLFFMYAWGLGFAVTRFVKESDNLLERNLMRIGLGLSALPILIVVLSWLHIPLDWRLFLVLSAIFPIIYCTLKKTAFKSIKLKLSRSNIYILIVLLLFLSSFFMYHKGAFSYPYLEDDDSWSHAFAARYVSVEKTVFEPIEGKNTFQYMDAYPPSYPALIGILHQANPSLSQTLKFFNALIISLGLIFFYFFVKDFTRNKNKALFSTFALAMVPCYLSHFIWAHAYIVTLIPVVFYSLGRIRHDKRWVYISALAIASTWLVQLTQAVKITVLIGLYWLGKSIAEKKIDTKMMISELYALAAAFILWWGPMLLKYGSDFLTLGLSQSSNSAFTANAEKSYIGIIGSARKLYTFDDFFIAKSQNMINNPIGVGIILSLLLFISLIYIAFKFKGSISKKESWKLIAVLWLLFTFLGIHGGTRFPIAFWSFRFWMLFALPLSIIVSEGAFFLMAVLRKFSIPKTITLILIITGVWFTSGIQKYSVNTAMWGPGGWLMAKNEAVGYIWLKQNLPVNTEVFTFSRRHVVRIHGLDMYSCDWCSDIIEFRKDTINRTSEDIHAFLKRNDYRYAIIDAHYAEEFGANETNSLISSLTSSGLFAPAHQTPTTITLRIL